MRALVKSKSIKLQYQQHNIIMLRIIWCFRRYLLLILQLIIHWIFNKSRINYRHEYINNELYCIRVQGQCYNINGGYCYNFIFNILRKHIDSLMPGRVKLYRDPITGDPSSVQLLLKRVYKTKTVLSNAESLNR